MFQGEVVPIQNGTSHCRQLINTSEYYLTTHKGTSQPTKQQTRKSLGTVQSSRDGPLEVRVKTQIAMAQKNPAAILGMLL